MSLKPQSVPDDSRSVIEALKSRYPHIHEPKRQDICYATQNRQEAVKQVAQAGVDLVLVIGSATSSNSNRLREVAEREGVHAYPGRLRRATLIPNGLKAPIKSASPRVLRLRNR